VVESKQNSYSLLQIDDVDDNDNDKKWYNQRMLIAAARDAKRLASTPYEYSYVSRPNWLVIEFNQYAYVYLLGLRHVAFRQSNHTVQQIEY
jgi:hypothetical protein